jgi:DNA polymerase I-like protein with 3'-5' exonuclease and polymerase domains
MSSDIAVAIDTEGTPLAPWSLQFSLAPGTGYVIRATDRAGLDFFRVWLGSVRPVILFHSALYDLEMLRVLGIDVLGMELPFGDSMVMAYNLQLEPQGLKPLCARWCNMKMMHFDEVMGTASTDIAIDWLLMVQENEDEAHGRRCEDEFTRLTTTPYIDAKGKTQPGRRLKVAPKLPKSDLHKSIERCLRSKDPRKLWGDQVLDRHVAARPCYGSMWPATLDHVPLDRALHYAGRDADGTHRLVPQLEERLRANDLWDVYQADLGTVPLIDRMQQTGIRPDLAHFAALSGDLGFELVEIRTRLAERLVSAGGSPTLDAAFDFNPNSSDHVGALLFDQFGIASLKRTPGGDPSTNDKVLEALEKDQKLERPVRDIVADIREYREIYKLKHTFVDQIPDFTHRYPFDGRIHATFRITRVVTGRLAASDPNLLALPKHGKFAKRFREGFVADDGHDLASWDLSQIELRVLAHLSQDPVLLHAFRTGLDLHATLAQRIFGVAPKDQDESRHRLPAKAVNFGIPMGMTCVGLCLELRKNGVDVSEDDAQRWLNETMTLYKEVPVYQQGKIAEAKRFGFVCDIRGRRRYVGGIRSYDDATRSEAERFAFSTPIQAGAQEIMKEAEACLYTETLLPRWKRGDWVEPLIQIHDDLLIENGTGAGFTVYPHPTKPKKTIAVPKDLSLHREMVYAMTKKPAHWLTVPIETSGTIGSNWGKMHEIREAA